jgi:hypothetical protein
MGWVVSVTPRPRFTPGERTPPVPIGQEVGWASELVWTDRLQEQFFSSAGDRTTVVQSVVRHCTELPRLPHLLVRVPNRLTFLLSVVWRCSALHWRFPPPDSAVSVYELFTWPHTNLVCSRQWGSVITWLSEYYLQLFQRLAAKFW